MRRSLLISLALILIASLGIGPLKARVALANGVAYSTGDVFAAVYNGQVLHYSPSGTLRDTLNSGTSFNYMTGMCFDSAGNLRTTTFNAQVVSEFDNGGNLLATNWASGFTYDPESCEVDASGNVYVGEADGTGVISKFDASGHLLTTYNVAHQNRGSDWIDLASDQCTMYYTSEGIEVKRFNVCTNNQRSDFASIPGVFDCYALRIRPNGEVMVACSSEVVRLDASGNVIQTYPASNYGDGFLFAMNLDPDGTSFWTSDISTGKIDKIAIADGSDEKTIITGQGVYGLGVYGEITASNPPPTNAPPTLSLPGDQTVQYSDALTFGISANDPEASDTVTLSASGLPSGLTFTDNGNRTGTVAGTAQVAAGTHPVTFSANDGHNPSATQSLNIIVTREDAVVSLSSSNRTAVKVNSPGGAAGPITLNAAVTEKTDDTTNGDISNAMPVQYTLTPVGSGSSYGPCTATTGGGGVGGTLNTSCTFNNVAVNVYDVHISIGNNYYQGSADTVLAVYDPSLGLVTGGGLIMDPSGYLANFGFNAKYLKSGQMQGSVLYVEHQPSGDQILKSNAMGSLSIVGNTAYILGKATYNGVGSYSFRVTAIDNGEPGTSDQLGMQVKDPSGAVVPNLTFNPITLSGGNIVVPHS